MVLDMDVPDALFGPARTERCVQVGARGLQRTPSETSARKADARRTLSGVRRTKGGCSSGVAASDGGHLPFPVTPQRALRGFALAPF